MPSWTDDEGFNWFNKLECKRCLSVFESNNKGEVPIHQCVDGKYYTSGYVNSVHHYPVEVSKQEMLEYLKKKRTK